MERRQKSENSVSRRSLATRYAALNALVDIANRVHAEGWRQTDFVALARSLTRAQKLAGTPDNARLGNTTLVQLQDGPALTISPLMKISTSAFYSNALDMRSYLIGIVEACERARRGLFRPISVLHQELRMFGLSPDFTIDPGPELFSDTLLRALSGRDIRRIRLCPKCPHLFIAVPSDRTGCSRQCASAQRVKKFRDANPGYYAQEQRRQRAAQRLLAAKQSNSQPKTAHP